MPLPHELSSSLQQLIKSLLNLSTPGNSRSEPRRFYSTLFRELPDRQLYSDYYVFIKEPRALQPILDSLNHSRYSSPQAVAYDLFLVWNNAREYNEIGSQVYNDAEKLQKQMEKLWRERVPPLPPFESLPRPGMLYPAQTGAAASSSSVAAATPREPSSEPSNKRIKIMSSTLNPSAATPPPPSGPQHQQHQQAVPKLRLALGGAQPSQPVTSTAPPPLPSLPLPIPASHASAPPLTLKLKPPNTIQSPMLSPPPPAHSPSPLPSPLPNPIDPRSTLLRQHSSSSHLPPQPATPPIPGPAPLPTASSSSSSSHSHPAPPPPPSSHSSESLPRRPIQSSIRPVEQPQAIKLPNGLLTDEETGWMGNEIPSTHLDDPSEWYLSILNTLKEYTDSEGRRLSEPLLTISHDRERERERYGGPQGEEEAIAFDIVEQRILNREYDSPQSFDKDLYKVFEYAKTFIKPVEEGSNNANEDNGRYADLLVLQRVYQELTKRHLERLPEPKELTLSALSSVVLGPGNCEGKDPADGEPKTSQTRISLKDKIFLDHLNFKGHHLKVGDWCHLLNPDNPSKPIIAQIFKVYKKTDSPQRCLSVCWYYRPEETIHPQTRTFYENEVFKSGQFVDHVIEDFIDKIFVMFFTRYIRGRPKPPVWDESLPLYVVEHRYKDEMHSFKKIKNWNSCVPEEIRKQEYALQTFNNGEPVVLPRYPSPFLKGVNGPGHFGEALDEGGSNQLSNNNNNNNNNNNGTKMTSSQKDAIGSSTANNARGRYNSSSTIHTSTHSASQNNDSSIQPIINSSRMRANSVQPEDHPLPPNHINTINGNNNSITASSMTTNQFDYRNHFAHQQLAMPYMTMKDRSTPLELAAQQDDKFEELPLGLRNKLRKDEQGQVLWFASPGLAEIEGAEVEEEENVKSHSLDYLYWKVTQEVHGDAMDVEL